MDDFLEGKFFEKTKEEENEENEDETNELDNEMEEIPDENDEEIAPEDEAAEYTHNFYNFII